MNTVGRTLHYNSSPLTTSLTRYNTYFSPSLYFQYYDRNWTRGAYLNMVINHVLPQMNQLIDRRNDANPLAVQTGNPSLRPSTSYRYDAMLRTGKRERDRALSLWWHTEVVRNAIGTGYTYDPTSGVRTYHPININGNWNGGAEFYIDTAIDSLKRWHFHSGTDYDFVRTKDLANVVGSDAQPFAAVQNHRLKQELRLQYNSGKLGLTWKGDAAWRRLLRDDGYDTGNSSLWEYNYGMELTYELPLGLNFNTTCYMHSRRGYQDETMNDDDLIWNAQLSRTFLKGKLTTTLLARDLLGQVSNTTYEVNAQGRTERWTNSLGRYLLLQFTYKFNTTPKKK